MFGKVERNQSFVHWEAVGILQKLKCKIANLANPHRHETNLIKTVLHKRALRVSWVILNAVKLTTDISRPSTQED